MAHGAVEGPTPSLRRRSVPRRSSVQAAARAARAAALPSPQSVPCAAAAASGQLTGRPACTEGVTHLFGVLAAVLEPGVLHRRRRPHRPQRLACPHARGREAKTGPGVSRVTRGWNRNPASAGTSAKAKAGYS